MVISNLNVSDNHPLWQTPSLKRSVVLNVNGTRVGFVGYLAPDTANKTKAHWFSLTPEIDAVKYVNTNNDIIHNRTINNTSKIQTAPLKRELGFEEKKNCFYSDRGIPHLFPKNCIFPEFCYNPAIFILFQKFQAGTRHDEFLRNDENCWIAAFPKFGKNTVFSTRVCQVLQLGHEFFFFISYLLFIIYAHKMG